MIPPETIDKIFSASNIVEVVSDFITLKKAGVNYQACCPFHDEKTPSFSVSPAKNIYKCFGCGKGGGPVNFVMEHKSYSYPEALKYLAQKYSIEIKENKEKTPNQEKIKIDTKEKLYHINKMAARHFYENLWKPENAVALEYALSRFTKEELIQNGVGFAPDSFDDLLKFFRVKKIKEEYFLLSNLIRESENKKKLYDFFRNRLIFPIIQNDQVKGFGGRLLPKNEGPKYLNSSDSLIYNKSETVFGLNYAYKQIQKLDNCNIVEGYTDVIRMHSLDINNTIAPCGTALTFLQLRLIKRFTKTITLIYDGDSAGLKAANKNGIIAIEQGLNVYIVSLPEKEDPESFFKTNEQYRQYVKDNKKDFILQKANALFETSGNDPQLRHHAINDICNLLSNFDKSKQDVCIEQIAKSSKQKAKLFQDKLTELRKESSGEKEERTWLPETIDPNEFEKWGFYSDNNEYFFRSKTGIEQLSNFIMKPVFHITSIFDSRRIFELINVYGYRVVVNLDMQQITSLQAFQKEIESRGNYLFWGQMSHLQKLKQKLYKETRTCEEIKNLGWQKEGFWA